MTLGLSPNEIKKINLFSTWLANDLENFQSNVLKLLSDYFGFHYSCFVASDNTLQLRKIVGHNVNTEYLEEYQQKNRCQDIFVMYLKNMNQDADYNDFSINNVLPNSIISIGDILSYNEYEKNDYCHFLAKQNFYYEIDMNLIDDNSGKYTISIFKPKEEGDFTQNERLLLNCLLNIINANFSKYLLKQQLQTEINILKNTIENLPFGVIIFDNNINIINYNKLALDYCCSITNENNVNNVFDKISQMLFVDGYYEKSYNYNSTINKHIDQYNIDIIPAISFNINNVIEKHYIVYIKIDNNNTQSSNDITEAYYKYDLTKRELEIAKLMCEGYNNDEIAEQLFISIYTVRTHLENIYRKIGANNRTAAIIKLNK